ncbi:MAG: ABC transporter ATP-binding protein [Methanobacteriota archaeon]|nr:MAG: ABC transporter ATP-binding protein [Euryarchaeota archaeon]
MMTRRRNEMAKEILRVKGLEGGYGSVKILHGIDLYVNEGEFVTIIGPNGCGKSTFIKVFFGLATYNSGEVFYDGEDVRSWRTDRLAAKGIAYVPQVDNVFPSLNVRENLQMGALGLSNKEVERRITRALEMFPDLAPRLRDLAASLSGGQRQMLAISRALMSDPSFILLDEPTAAFDNLRKNGITILIVEQNAKLSLARSDRGYIFAGGKVVHTGDAKEILEDGDIGAHFLGFQEE